MAQVRLAEPRSVLLLVPLQLRERVADVALCDLARVRIRDGVEEVVRLVDHNDGVGEELRDPECIPRRGVHEHRVRHRDELNVREERAGAVVGAGAELATKSCELLDVPDADESVVAELVQSALALSPREARSSPPGQRLALLPQHRAARPIARKLEAALVDRPRGAHSTRLVEPHLVVDAELRARGEARDADAELVHSASAHAAAVVAERRLAQLRDKLRQLRVRAAAVDDLAHARRRVGGGGGAAAVGVGVRRVGEVAWRAVARSRRRLRRRAAQRDEELVVIIVDVVIVIIVV